jgi:predicted nucleotidyltransferase
MGYKGKIKYRKEQIDRYRTAIIQVLSENDVEEAGVFGSFARNEAKNESDLDILVKFGKAKSLFDLARIELEKKLNRKVDLITYNSINPLIKERILTEEAKLI